VRNAWITSCPFPTIYFHNIYLYHIYLHIYNIYLHNIYLHNIYLHNIYLHNIYLHNIYLHNVIYTTFINTKFLFHKFPQISFIYFYLILVRVCNSCLTVAQNGGRKYQTTKEVMAQWYAQNGIVPPSPKFVANGASSPALV
jgi:hypothetical protein